MRKVGFAHLSLSAKFNMKGHSTYVELSIVDRDSGSIQLETIPVNLLNVVTEHGNLIGSEATDVEDVNND